MINVNTPLGLKKKYANLNNNLLKELKRYYQKNKLEEPKREDGEVYLEELQFIQRLELNFSGIVSFAIGDKSFPSYLTGLKRLTIKKPCLVSNDFISDLPNKNQITSLTIDGSDFVNLDLTEFTKLEELVIIRNNNLLNIKGLENLKKLSYIEFYDNQLIDEEQACKFLIENMKNNAEMKIDILYYKRITSLIRKEYSSYRDAFRNAKWVEAISAGLENHSTIEHSTVATGRFYSRLQDILNEIIPKNLLPEDEEAIYLIYCWIIENVSYDHAGVKNKLRMRTMETKLNFGDRVQKVRMGIGSIGGTNGAFNAIYGKSVVCQGFTKIMQMFLKVYDYTIKTFDEDAYCEVNPNKEALPLNKLLSRTSSPINHSILRIVLENDSYFCDATNEKRDAEGNILQTRFMKTFEELTTKWYPVSCPYPGKSEPLTEEEREELSKLRLSHNIPFNYETSAVKMIERFALHITGELENLELELDIKKIQAEDLLLLGIINAEALKIIQNQQAIEYMKLCEERKSRKKG